ncbi:MAG: ImmA/IrrE family metallo-endopeptidase [Candidatus Alcyoniella australis]|nr:ImmA/IrrE family metallo-endopeptidase [Candidatus Alcyoniella australis]
MIRVQVPPELLIWACKRAGLDVDSLSQKGSFRKLPDWISGEARPTLKQLEVFAKATHAPFGYFFLQEPPKESVPIPDLRTVGNQYIGHPSPDLLDTIYICQQRQEWYRDFARTMGNVPLPFVGSDTVKSDVIQVAENIRQSLGFSVEQRRNMSTWTDALRHFIGQADSFGIMVMVSGIVGSNTRRPLDPQEFRGFALSDPLAPLVFINGKDTKAAQMFTLAHELAHIWLGESALSDVTPTTMPSRAVEAWCNKVAAELLVPIADLLQAYKSKNDLRMEMDRLARRFKVSTLVILRRLHDAAKLSRDEYWNIYDDELERLRAIAASKGKGGDFYLSLPARVSKRFARAIVISTLEGQTLHRDAFRLLGFRQLATFHELGHQLGVA